MTGGDVQFPEVNSLFREDKGHWGSKRQYPHGCTGDGCIPWPPPSQGVDRVNNSKKTIHTDASYEQNRAIHVPVEGCGDHTAHERAKYPVVAIEVVRDFEGEQHGENQVSTGQVQHEDGCWFLRPDPLSEGEHGTDVDWYADEANEHVERRYEDGGQRALQKQQRLFWDS